MVKRKKKVKALRSPCRLCGGEMLEDEVVYRGLMKHATYRCVCGRSRTMVKKVDKVPKLVTMVVEPEPEVEVEDGS